jgi:hypothetical protein
MPSRVNGVKNINKFNIILRRCNVAACGEDCNTMVNSCYRDIKLKTFQKPGPEEKCKKFEECIEYKSEACYDAYDKIRRYQILFMENC